MKSNFQKLLETPVRNYLLIFNTQQTIPEHPLCTTAFRPLSAESEFCIFTFSSPSVKQIINIAGICIHRELRTNSLKLFAEYPQKSIAYLKKIKCSFNRLTTFLTHLLIHHSFIHLHFFFSGTRAKYQIRQYGKEELCDVTYF